MNRIEKAITVILAIVVIAASFYVVSTSAWFDLDGCPNGSHPIVTTWTSNTGEVSVSKICVGDGQ